MKTYYSITGPFRKADGLYHCFVLLSGVNQHTIKHRQKGMARRLAQQWCQGQKVMEQECVSGE